MVWFAKLFGPLQGALHHLLEDVVGGVGVSDDCSGNGCDSQSLAQ